MNSTSPCTTSPNVVKSKPERKRGWLQFTFELLLHLDETDLQPAPLEGRHLQLTIVAGRDGVGGNEGGGS